MTLLTDEERAKLVELAREIAVDDLIAMTVSWTETQKVARALLAADAAVRGMREALEWQPIDTAPQGEDVLIAVFRDDFEDPIIQNSILIDGEEKGLYWSDWHGMPDPTHWMRYPAVDAADNNRVVWNSAAGTEVLARTTAANSLAAIEKETKP